MTRYAEQTAVSSDRSRAEIEKTLSRYGATGFMYGWSGERARVAFEMRSLRVMFELPLPARDEFGTTPTGRARSAPQTEAAYEQAVRQRWRALALVIKAKLEAVETGITSFEEEFLAHLVLPGGETVGQRMIPELRAALEGRPLPPLLPGPRR